MIYPSLGGIKIIRVDSFITVKRTWQERLFSWPWRPFNKTKLIENPGAPKVGEGYQIGDTFYLRTSDAIILEQKLREVNQ